MKKVTQQLTDIGGDIPGDCWRACIASLLGLDLEDVPHFLYEYPEPGTRWYTETVKFVEEKVPGWTLVCIDPNYPIYEASENIPEYVIQSGKSPRGDFFHAVITDSRTGEMVWDVHPDRTGILTHSDTHALTTLPSPVRHP